MHVVELKGAVACIQICSSKKHLVNKVGIVVDESKTIWKMYVHEQAKGENGSTAENPGGTMKLHTVPKKGTKLAVIFNNDSWSALTRITQGPKI